MNTLTGQYENVHHSGVGLDYFTARIDRLTLLANRRYTLITQEKSRVSHAARSLLSGQQLDMNAPEARREGSYSAVGDTLTLYFDDGTQEQGQITANGIQFGKDFFEKVSDSTMLPPTNRMKSNMEDIAKGLKIAGAIGGAAIKAVKTIQDTVQAAQGQGQPSTTPTSQASSQGASQQAQGYQPSAQPARQAQPVQPAQQPTPAATPAQDDLTLFCDQCGAPARPGKKFCNQCGARLP